MPSTSTKKRFTASEIAFDEFDSAICPVFNLKGIDDKKVLELKQRVFEDYSDEIVEELPLDLRVKYNLLPIKDAIRRGGRTNVRKESWKNHSGGL